jgi:hypothetical protein
MRQRMLLKTPFWRSATTPDFPLLYLSARASVFIAIGRWQIILILRHGSDTRPGSLPNCDVVASSTNELRTSLRSSDRQERTTANSHPLAEWWRDH